MVTPQGIVQATALATPSHSFMTAAVWAKGGSEEEGGGPAGECACGPFQR